MCLGKRGGTDTWERIRFPTGSGKVKLPGSEWRVPTLHAAASHWLAPLVSPDRRKAVQASHSRLRLHFRSGSASGSLPRGIARAPPISGCFPRAFLPPWAAAACPAGADSIPGISGHPLSPQGSKSTPRPHSPKLCEAVPPRDPRAPPLCRLDVQNSACQHKARLSGEGERPAGRRKQAPGLRGALSLKSVTRCTNGQRQ